MKKWIILILTACVAVSCGDANSRYVRRAISYMDKHGLYAEGPAWEAARAEALAAKPDSLGAAYDITRKALKVAGGKHSFIYQPKYVQEDLARNWDNPSVRVEDGIVIIQVPAFAGSDEAATNYARSTQDKIPDEVRGAVIDLRGNTGGNMGPMIASVHRFIQDDDILCFRGRNHRNTYHIRNLCATYGITPGKQIDCPVAVLTDTLTASSGEAVLICFRGMPRARTFGMQTAGYASGNRTFDMPDGSKLVVTASCDVARTGEEFCDDPIVPDVPTETPLEDALAWLREQAASSSE